MREGALDDEDIVASSEAEVAALRRLAKGLRPNLRELCFENSIGAIGDMGPGAGRIG